MPAETVNQTVLPAEYAVPMASLALSVHRGAIPGAPNARLAVRVIAILAFPSLGRAEVALGGVFAGVAREIIGEMEPPELARGPDVGGRDGQVRPIHAPGRDVDRVRPCRLAEGQRRTAGGAQLPHRTRRRAELRRHPGGENEGGGGERRPGDEWRARR